MSPRRVTALVSLFSLTSIFVACSSDTSDKADLTTEVCPTKLTIQTDWFPELEHGGTYQLIGPSGTADKNSVSYSGPVQQQYAVGGLQEVEILTKNFDANSITSTAMVLVCCNNRIANCFFSYSNWLWASYTI